MKKILYHSLIPAIAAAFFCSCDYLDQKPDNLRTMDKIWETRADAESYLNNIYSYIWLPIDNFSVLGVADETSCCLSFDVPARSIIEGNWNASSNYWSWHYTDSYKAIRASLIFEANVDKVPQSLMSDDIKAQHKAESKFLRGWFYWKLLRMYGPYAKVDEPVAIDGDWSVYSRSTFEECVDHICSLMEEAQQGLPVEWTSSSQYGRPTKGSCLAIISQVRLLAASELWNGNKRFADFKNRDGTLMAPLEYSEEKWRLAAEAALDVIHLDAYRLFYNTDEGDSAFDPYLSCRNIFLTNWNKEIIFSTHITEWLGWYWGHEKRCAPGPAGFTMTNATQNIVDAFYMRNGLDKDDDPSYTEVGFATSDDPAAYGLARDGMNRGYLAKESNMYVNREPRFYVNILYNGRPLLPAPNVDDKNHFSSEENKDGRGRAEFYFSGQSGASARNSPDLTGYNVQKIISPASNIRVDDAAYRPFIHIRYAEILLNYIEALNEYDPLNPDIVTYFNEIRNRAGIPGIDATYPEEIGDRDKMRARILREREVEFAFEGDRYWTLCRRLLFEKEEYRTIGRLNVNANDNGLGFDFADFYIRTTMPTRYWDNKMYLFPIPQSELERGSGLVQNPGW